MHSKTEKKFNNMLIHKTRIVTHIHSPLFPVLNPSASSFDKEKQSIQSLQAYHLAFPSANAGLVCSVLSVKRGFSMIGISSGARYCLKRMSLKIVYVNQQLRDERNDDGTFLSLPKILAEKIDLRQNYL